MPWAGWSEGILGLPYTVLYNCRDLAKASKKMVAAGERSARMMPTLLAGIYSSHGGVSWLSKLISYLVRSAFRFLEHASSTKLPPINQKTGLTAESLLIHQPAENLR